MSYYCGLIYCRDKIFRTIQGDCFLQSYTSLNSLCEIVQFLPNTVIIVTYFAQGQHRVLVITIVTGECDILIIQTLLFKGLCEIIPFLLDAVIVVTYFVRGHHCIFVVVIVTVRCALLILNKLWIVVCHWLCCLLIYNYSIILSCFVLNWPIVKWWNGGWLNGVMEK